MLVTFNQYVDGSLTEISPSESLMHGGGHAEKKGVNRAGECRRVGKPD
jgi:hypothetical protein